MLAVVNRQDSAPAIRGSLIGVLGALALTCADLLEQKLLGRPQLYVPRAIAWRLFGGRSLFDRARTASVRGLALRTIYSAGLGALYGTWRQSFPRSPTMAGLSLGAEIWAFELVAMPAIRAVPPLRQWPRAEIALLLAHALVFSMTTALTYDRLAARAVGSRRGSD